MPDRNVKKNVAGEDVKQVIEHARRWITSEEGKQKVAKSLESALKTTTYLQEIRRVDPKTLQEPVTRQRT